MPTPTDSPDLKQKEVHEGQAPKEGQEHRADMSILGAKPEQMRHLAQKASDSGPPESPEQLGMSWDLSAKVGKFDNVNKEMSHAVKDAYDKGGMKAVTDLDVKVNKNCQTEGGGVAFIKHGDKIEIHNIQQLSEKDQETYSKLSPEDQKKLGVKELPGYGMVKELGPEIDVNAPPRPDKSGGKLDSALTKDEAEFDKMVKDHKMSSFLVEGQDPEKLAKFVKDFDDPTKSDEDNKLAKIMMMATLMGGKEGEAILKDVKENLAPAAGLSKEELRDLAATTRDKTLWDQHVETNMSILNGFVGDLGGSLTR